MSAILAEFARFEEEIDAALRPRASAVTLVEIAVTALPPLHFGEQKVKTIEVIAA